jgi:hypothetical protein
MSFGAKKNCFQTMRGLRDFVAQKCAKWAECGPRGGGIRGIEAPSPFEDQKMSFGEKKMFPKNAWFMGFIGPKMHTNLRTNGRPK